MKAEERYIPGHEGRHVVSSLGYVRKVGTKKRNYGTWNNRNDLVVHLVNNKGKSKMYSMSRLVAQVFLDNPDGKTQVDHIDTDRSNNKVDNLRWVWPMENVANYLTAVHRKEPKLFAKKRDTKACVAYLPTGEIINANSMSDMAKKLNCSGSTVRRICEGEQKYLNGAIRIEYNRFEQLSMFG